MNTAAVYLSQPGIVCSLGNTIDTVWQHLFSEAPAATQPFHLLNGEAVPVSAVQSALPAVSDSLQYLNARTNQLALCAVQQIQDLIQACSERVGAQRVAVIAGTSTSGIANSETDYCFAQEHDRHQDHYHYAQHELASPATFLKQQLGLRGIDYSVSTACTSGAKAISCAAHLIRNGLCDAAVAGGVDSLCQTTVNGFDALGLVSRKPANPFSKNRQGLHIGEGAAFFLLSRQQDAIMLRGSGEASDAHHISSPDPGGSGAITAMQQALKQAGCRPVDIDYLNLHGTGTRLNDSMEATAVSTVFTDKPPCSSSKGQIGHCLGAAGAIEAALCWKTLSADNRQHQLPPHQWDAVADNELPHLPFTVSSSRPDRLDICMSNNFAFGGNNVSLVLARS